MNLVVMRANAPTPLRGGAVADHITIGNVFCQAGVLSAFSSNNLIQIPPDTNK